MNRMFPLADPVARALMSALFLLSGFGKLAAPDGAAAYMSAFGVAPILLWPTIAFEIGGGALLLVGLFSRPVALLMAGFSVLTAVIFHRQIADQIQMIMLLKNLGLAGGFLLLAKDGAPGFSLDAARGSRRPAVA